MKFIILFSILTCTSVYGQTGFELIETNEAGKMYAECLPELAVGADSCKFVMRKGDYFRFDLLYQFDKAHKENQTWETRDDSFLKAPIKITFYTDELDELNSFNLIPSKVSYTKSNGKDAVYIRFSKPRLIQNFKESALVMLEIKSELYLFELNEFESIYDLMNK
jgi:hypothetical protein